MKRWILTLIVAVMVAASCNGNDADSGQPASLTELEVLFEAADEPGPDAFTSSVDTNDLDLEGAYGVLGEGEIAQGAVPACDLDEFVAKLKARPDAYREWGAVLDIPEDQIDEYILGLETKRLSDAIRVTNHGLADGTAYARQSELEAGTAVLVDPRSRLDPPRTLPPPPPPDGTREPNGTRPGTTGTPATTSPPPDEGGDYRIVTRCKCGNPLLPPIIIPGQKTVRPGTTTGTRPETTGTRGTTPPATEPPGTPPPPGTVPPIVRIPGTVPRQPATIPIPPELSESNLR